MVLSRIEPAGISPAPVDFLIGSWQRKRQRNMPRAVGCTVELNWGGFASALLIPASDDRAVCRNSYDVPLVLLSRSEAVGRLFGRHKGRRHPMPTRVAHII
jgi:hypothetical protein